MVYAIFSDIHGNLEALEVAIDALSERKIDSYMCIGDIVGYGANPKECIKKTKELSSVIIRGNHDAAASGAKSPDDFNNSARVAVEWTQSELSQKEITFLKNLELVYKNQYITLVHGTLYEPESFYYMFDEASARATFNLMETQTCFVGHSHVPGIFIKKQNKIKYFYKEKLKLNKNEKAIINVGSIGQPRDGDPRLCCCLYDVDKSVVELKRLPYDVEKTQSKILKAGLPPSLAQRLGEGI